MRKSQKIGAVAVGMMIWLSFLPAGASAQTIVEMGQWHLLLSGDALELSKIDDDAGALHWMELAAEQGLPHAQHHLGVMYAYGRGVTQDDAAAVRWYRLAAEQGYAPAQTSLGYMYQHGRGVTQDDAAAVRWYWLAAEQGDADGQNNLGALSALGKGVRRDVAVAFSWFSVAALQGHADAQTNMLQLVDEMTRAEINMARSMTAAIQRRQANAESQ